MLRREIGSILIVLGTCLGAGMLVLPVAAASQNTYLNLSAMAVAWFCMTLGAFALLAVNLRFPLEANMLSMARKTLGRPGEVVMWISLLLLYYTLICAYVAASSDVLQGLLALLGLDVPLWLTAILTILFLGSIVYGGMVVIDMSNRFLMSAKLILLVLLLAFLMPHVNTAHFVQGEIHLSDSVFILMITVFGFSPIIPSLREYLVGNAKRTTRVVLIGSLGVLVMYCLWIIAVQGSTERFGPNGLIAISTSQNPNTHLMESIAHLTQSSFLKSFGRIFVSICALTSFLGVSIGLVDFLGDGLKWERVGFPRLKLLVLSYLPPLIIVIAARSVFIYALSYAGLLCVIALFLLPLAMFASQRWFRKN